MEQYSQANPEDPDWLAKAALFHGHLGPWLALGTMIGRDAVASLETPGLWMIDVRCAMPVDRHRTPFTCILDGLQCGSGATMGKCNLHLEPCDEHGGWPIVRVFRRAEPGRLAAGVIYQGTPRLHDWLRTVNPANLEARSREMAAMPLPHLAERRTCRDAQPTDDKS